MAGEGTEREEGERLGEASTQKVKGHKPRELEARSHVPGRGRSHLPLPSGSSEMLLSLCPLPPLPVVKGRRQIFPYPMKRMRQGEGLPFSTLR